MIENIPNIDLRPEDEKELLERLMASEGRDESLNKNVSDTFLTDPDNPEQNKKDVLDLFGVTDTKIIGIKPSNHDGQHKPPISFDDLEDGDIIDDDNNFGLF